MAIHHALLRAVQLHPAGAVTTTAPLAPAAGKDCEVGEIEYVQGVDPAAWLMVMVSPAMVKVPVREEVPLLAPTE